MSEPGDNPINNSRNELIEIARRYVSDGDWPSVVDLMTHHLPLVLRAAGDDAVAEALREVGWTVTPQRQCSRGPRAHAGPCTSLTNYVAKSQWRPMTPKGDEHGE